MPGRGPSLRRAPAGAERFSALNGTLAQNIRRKLMPALEQSQGFRGTYSRAGSNRPLTAIPTAPDWVSEDDHTVIEEWAGVVFIVSAAEWATTGFGLPQQADRFTVTMADGVQRVYALLPSKGMRPYDMPAGANHYSLRMKWVKG